jgi:flagellar hook-basal body complex protein FliE
MDQAMEAVRRGEREQTDLVKEQGRARLAALEDETDDRLRELNRRYRAEQTLLDDRYDDQADREREAADESFKANERQISARYDQYQKAIRQDKALSEEEKDQRLDILRSQEEEELGVLRKQFASTQKLRDRQIRDARRREEDALEDRRKNEESVIKKNTQAQSRIIEAATTQQLEIVQANAKKSADAIENGTKGVGETLKKLGISAVDASGKMRPLDQLMLDIADKFSKLPNDGNKAAMAMDLFGRSGINLIPMLNEGRAALEKYQATISTDMAVAADKFNDTLNQLARDVMGPFNQALQAMLPALTQFANAVSGLVIAFSKMPVSLQTTILALTGLAFAFNLLAGPIGLVIKGFQLLAGLKIGATIAGWAPVIVQLGPKLLGLARILIGIFTGPVGWAALLISAGVALYVFRDKVVQVFQGLVILIGAAFNGIRGILNGAVQSFINTFVQPIINLSRVVVNAIGNAFRQLGAIITAPFTAAFNVVRNVIRNLLAYVTSGINRAIGVVNRLIGAYNRLPAPDIPLVPSVSVPAFAEGGTVNKPTLALVGEGGQREYIIPESRMAQASANYLAGSRGNAVLSDRNGAGGGLSIQIQTGPVLQQNGQNWVSVRDMEQALNTLADSLLSNNRTPGGRRYQGVAA